MYELAADFLVGESERCWGCATDLSAVIAQHLATCRVAASFVEYARRGWRLPRAGSREARQRIATQWSRVDETLARAEDLLREIDVRRHRRTG
jgi:hypothetical protein